jgi:hypothetical protein
LWNMIKLQKPTVINGTTHATEITFSGHGTAKDINFTDNSNALIIPRGGSAVLLKGKDNLVASGGDKASLNFMELGHVDNGMVKASPSRWIIYLLTCDITLPPSGKTVSSNASSDDSV